MQKIRTTVTQNIVDYATNQFFFLVLPFVQEKKKSLLNVVSFSANLFLYSLSFVFPFKLVVVLHYWYHEIFCTASKVDLLHLRYFRFSGRVIALALMHKIQVGIVLDRIFFLQLAGRHVSVEDIQDADPCLYNSCKQILDMDCEFVDSEALGLAFISEVEELGSRRVVELCPGGREIVVNSQNRKDYVNLIVQHRFVQSISEHVSSFAQGFADILHYGKLRESFFQSLELEDLDMMLYGSGNEISVEDWKAHTDYDGYRESDPQIVWFWEVCRCRTLLIPYLCLSFELCILFFLHQR